MKSDAYVKLLLDETGELIGAEIDGEIYPATVAHEHKVPHLVQKDWDLKLIKVWHNSPCCVQMGNKLVCWPPCV